MPARRITQFMATPEELQAWSTERTVRRFTDPAGTVYERWAHFGRRLNTFVIARRDVDGVWLSPLRHTLSGVEDQVAEIVRGDDT
jgi:hypothetical protein